MPAMRSENDLNYRIVLGKRILLNLLAHNAQHTLNNVFVSIFFSDPFLFVKFSITLKPYYELHLYTRGFVLNRYHLAWNEELIINNDETVNSYL